LARSIAITVRLKAASDEKSVDHGRLAIRKHTPSLLFSDCNALQRGDH